MLIYVNIINHAVWYFVADASFEKPGFIQKSSEIIERCRGIDENILRNINHFQHFHGSLFQLAFRQIFFVVVGKIFDDLLANFHGRVQRNQRILENHRAFFATEILPLFFSEVQNIFAIINDLASLFDFGTEKVKMFYEIAKKIWEKENQKCKYARFCAFEVLKSAGEYKVYIMWSYMGVSEQEQLKLYF